ncbi:MAG: hypothetical protein P1U39_03085 [Legionellaceae bacterium]|nr:hypothetical protein [Legionellaceae bacterium]
MKTKDQAIRLFLDNFQTALDQAECKTLHDRFLVDLLLEQHQKTKHACELLNFWGNEQRNIDRIYDYIHKQYGVIHCTHTSAELFFVLLQQTVIELKEISIHYQLMKNDILDAVGPYLLGTLFCAAELVVVHVAFHVFLPLMLGLAACGALAVVLLSCSALFFYAVEKHIQHSITQIQAHNNFTRTYDDSPVSEQLETTRATSTTTSLRDDATKITISTPNSPWSFFENRSNNGSNAIFESIMTHYNSTCENTY